MGKVDVVGSTVPHQSRRLETGNLGYAFRVTGVVSRDFDQTRNLMYWRHGALIERGWQQSDDAPDWEPCDPHILRVVGMKGGLVKVFERASSEL